MRTVRELVAAVNRAYLTRIPCDDSFDDTPPTKQSALPTRLRRFGRYSPHFVRQLVDSCGEYAERPSAADSQSSARELRGKTDHIEVGDADEELNRHGAA